ncbi:hypothetical protein RC083_17105 [Pseudoalteromonas haloplanktis]|uniref:Uncharacterized protein n=1 Tax=Pseudoalteromonas haloplanktis TaxID=228 RepID=A0ABU1BIF0_PSEHA|nr:hypothetical protein [Pseudoalteromonas haloplanktis]MDQ9093299.1 hypothetical protein [Pseudoalteromonas haloplanktis]
MEFKKSLLALSIVAVLSGCGGSSDDKPVDGKDPIVTEPVTPVVSEALVQGVASKGTLKNAQLTFFKYVEGEAVELTANELGESSLVTDENGQYQVTLNDVKGIVKVQVSASSDAESPTLMVCDAPKGCGVDDTDTVVKFGDDVNLTLQDPEFSLTSILSISSENTNTQDTANITPLTHMATALAESRGSVSEQAIADAQSEIANTFGLVGALNLLTPGALEAPSSLFDSNNSNAMRYALINAGIANSLYLEEPELALSTKLSSAVADMVAANGAFLASSKSDDDDDFEFSLEDVLTGSEQALAQLIEVIANDPALIEHLDDLEQAATNLANEIQVKITQAGDDGRIKGKVSDETQGDAIAKASAMVNDIRLFANLFDVTNSSGADFESQGEQFVSLVEAAGDMVAEQADSFALLSDVIEAVTEIHQQLENGEVTGTVFDLADYLTTAGTGRVTIDEENLIFSVTAQSGEEKLSLDVAINALTENTQYQLLLSGMAENAAVEFTIAEGSHATLTLDSAVTRAQIESGDVNAEPTKGELKLNVALAQKVTTTVTNPVSFTGALTAELLPLQVYSAEYSHGSWNQSAWDYTLEQDMLVLPKMASLSGEFSSLEGELVKATATVNIKDLESYIPPELKGFGEMYKGIAEITINEANTALNLSVNDDETVTAYTFVKTAPDAGNWKVSANRTTDIEGYFQGSFTREAFTYQGVQFYLYNYYNEVNDDYYGYVEFIEQVEFDEYYQPFVVKRHYQYFKEYNDGVLITEDGSSIAVLDIMFNNYGEYHDYDDALNGLNIGIRTPVEQISTITDYFDDAFANDFSVVVGDKGSYRLIFDDNDTSLVAGLNTELNGYLVSPNLEDMLTITVSDEAATLQASVQDGEVQTINVARSSETNFSVDNVTVSKNGDFVQSETLTVKTQGEGLAQTITVEFFDRYLDDSWGRYEKLTAIDSNDDQITDSFNCVNFDFYSKTVDGLYYDYDGNLIDINEQSGNCGNFANFTEFAYSWQFSRFGINGENLASFTAVDTFKSRLYSINPPSIPGEEPTFEPVYYRSFVSGLGEVRADFTQPEHMQWSADGTYKIDMYLTQPELGTNVENEETFLDVNAALNVQVKVGEYNLELNLTGERTELEQGKLALDVKYLLPESDKQRSFIVSYDTKLETLSATNAENVKLVLAEPADEDAEQQVLGTIMVGDEKAAEIVKRDSLVLIVYENGIVETL